MARVDDDALDRLRGHRHRRLIRAATVVRGDGITREHRLRLGVHVCRRRMQVLQSWWQRPVVVAHRVAGVVEFTDDAAEMDRVSG